MPGYHSATGSSVNARSRKAASCSRIFRDDYVRISSSLGEAPPRNLIVLPVLFEGETKAVIELAVLDASSLPRISPFSPS